MGKIKRALISVYDKSGLNELATALKRHNIEIISTGGTARTLREFGVDVTEVSDYTNFPEILDGRVKTLHPLIHGGILYNRQIEKHRNQIEFYGIKQIDLVVVNLYPFDKIISKPGLSIEEAIENIDIGGPSMIRSAAKNYQDVTVVVDPLDYQEIISQLDKYGETTLELRKRLAIKAFARTAAYDSVIAAHLPRIIGTEPAPKIAYPSTLYIYAPIVQSLRYGENPHQQAFLYGNFYEYFEQLHGKELSYNNILDLSAAVALIYEFHGQPPTVAIIKHTNPCGVGQASTLLEAWEKAYKTDTQSPFGGIIAVNTTMDLATARAISDIFTEIIIAPEFDSKAYELLSQKKNLRLIKVRKDPRFIPEWEVRTVGADSYLWQTKDIKQIKEDDLQVVTARKPTPKELAAMLFGWKIVKHVKSNAVIFVDVDRTLGIGAGQMSRIDAVKVAIMKAKEASLSLVGSVVCSDAFFPFPDGVELAAKEGASAIIQPGGSIRDKEVIEVANRLGIAMVFTGVRHFKH